VLAVAAAIVVVALLAGVLARMAQLTHHNGAGANATTTPSFTPSLTTTPNGSPTVAPTATNSDGISPNAWHVVASPSVQGELTSIAADSATDIWAVGDHLDNSGAIIEHWNGTRWNILSTSGQRSQGLELTAVTAISANDVWMVGYNIAANNIRYTAIAHGNGSQVDVIPSPNQGTQGSALLGVTALTPDNIWAVGYYVTAASCSFLTEPLVEHWNGAQWSIVSTPTLQTQFGAQFNAITAVTANNLWAVGAKDSNALIEHWNGTSWSVVAAPTGATLNAATALSSGDVWAVGTNGNGSQPITIHWNGSGWTTVVSPPTTDYNPDLLGVAGVSPNDVWAVGGNPALGCSGTSTPLIEHWDGSTWSIVTSQAFLDLKPTPQTAFLDAVVAISATDVWAVGRADNSPLIMQYVP